MVFYLLIILIAISAIDYFQTREVVTNEVNYSDFLQQVQNGEVAKVTLEHNVVKGTLTDGTEFLTITPDAPNQDTNLLNTMQDMKV